MMGTDAFFSSSVRNEGPVAGRGSEEPALRAARSPLQISTNGIEIYKSVVATPKCLECR